MKIVSGVEPLYCEVNDVSHKVIVDISATSTKDQLLHSIRKWMPLSFESMVHLSDWKDVLNKIDQQLSNTLHTWRKNLVLLGKEDGGAEQAEDASYHADVEDLRTLLKFTSQLLKCAIYKEAYNSTEHLVELLSAYDDEIMILALDALLSLAVPPLSHRCNLDMTRHLTSLHRNTPYFDPLFEIIESSYFVTDIPIHQFLSADFQPTAAMRRVKVDLNTRSKYCKSLLTVDSNGDTQEIEKLLLPENHFELSDINTSSQSLKDILTGDAKALTLGLRYSLMCAVRMRRLVQSAAGRTVLLRLQYQATAILLGCHPDSAVLFSFFQDKVDLIKNFMYLLRTGPGSLDYKPDVVDLDIRLLACQCLEAIVGSRDQSSTPIFARYPWMMFDLGLNRGQYMGLLPCLIRSATSYLISLDAQDSEQAAADCAAAVESKMEVVSSSTPLHDPDVEDRLLWIENVFMLLIAIVNVSTALPALTDNGLIGSILLVMERLNLRNRSSTLIFVEIMTIEILESSVTSHSPAMTSFKEKNGMEVIINRLCRELQLYFPDEPSAPVSQIAAVPGVYIKGTATTIPVASSILIQEFFSLLTSVLQEGRNDSSDRNGQWYKMPALAQSLRLIFSNAKALGSLVLSPAVSLLAEIINNDPAPPSILSYMLSSGIAKEALCVLVGRKVADVDAVLAATSAGEESKESPVEMAASSTPEVAFSSDSMLSLLCLMSSLSLTAEGIALVTAVAPFPAMFNMFFDPQYVYPTSRILMQDLPNMVGTNLEELLRHYPAYSAPCLAALTHAMQVITAQAEKYVGRANFAHQSGDINFTDEFTQILHYSTGILLCLEPLVLKSQTVVELHRLGAFKHLTTFLKIALGPPRYVIDSFACMIDSTLNSLGYSPLIAMVISRVCNQIAELEQKRMFECLMEDLLEKVDCLEEDLLEYATRFGPAEVTRFIAGEVSSVHLVPPTASGNGNPLIEGLLDTVTRDPIQDCSDTEGPLSDKLLAFARVLRGFSLLDCLAEAIGVTLTTRGNIAQTKECIAQLTAASGRDLIARILNKLYLPTQLEMARARGMFVNSNKDTCVKAHPVYHLLVVASEHVVVKDSFEDTATKVCKLGRGCSVVAYERRCAGTSNMLKYRTKDGWINVFRNSSSSDPLVLVTHVSKKSAEDYAEEVARNQDVFSDADKRSDFEKFASVSAKRGGFLALYHFNHSVKSHLLSFLTRHMFTRDVSATGMQESITVSTNAVPLVAMLLGCITTLIPELTNATPRSTFDLDALFNGVKSPAAPAKATRTRGKAASSDKLAGAADAGSMPSVAVTSAILKEKYFQKDPVPLLDQFPTSMLYATIRLTEMSHMLFFEHRRGKNELNPLIMAHLVYNQEYLERIFHAATILFLCALPDIALETEDLPEHRHLYKGKWYPLKESELDQDREEVAEDSAGEADAASSASAMDVDATPDKKAKGKTKATKGKGKAKGKDVKDEEIASTAPRPAFTPFATYLAYRRALRERRLLAVSSIDNVANLWKLLCTSVSSSQGNVVQLTSTEKVLHREANDEHDYDPFAMRRHILNTLTKYLMQIWTHPQLHHLPPYTTKNVMDLLAVVIKSLHDLKSVTTVRAPLTAAPNTSHASALNSMDALLRSSRLGAAHRRSVPQQQLAANIATMRAAARSATVASVGEDNIRAMEEMGFSRRAILRAATELHTNDANQLVPYLLENPYYDEPEPPAAASSSTAAPADSTTTAAPAASSSSSSAPSDAAALVPAAGSSSSSAGAPDTMMDRAPSNFDEIYDHLMGAIGGLSPSMSRADLQSISSITSTVAIDGRTTRDKEKEEKNKVNPLPLIPKQVEASLKLERELVQRILKCIYGDVPSVCLGLIEHGPSKLLSLLDTDIKTANTGVSREVFTVQVLNNMVNCLDKNPLPDVLLRIVQLTWLYHRAMHFFGQEQLTETQYSALFGVLHAILVLLTSKVRTCSNPHQASCNELLLLVFTVDNRYNKLYPLMITALEKYSTELQAAEAVADGDSTEHADWIAPAILILDIVTQPILVDSGALGYHLTELDRYVKMDPTATLTDSAADLTSADDAILSEQVRGVINKTFLRKKTSSMSGLASLDDVFSYPGSRKAGRSFDGLFGFDMGAWDPPPEESAGSSAGSGVPRKRRLPPKTVITTASVPGTKDETKSDTADASVPTVEVTTTLPLYENAVSAELKMRCLNLGLGLLTLSSQGKGLSSTIPQATMQLIAHLTRHPDARKEFHKQQGGILILRCPSAFDGMPSVVFTLLQQVLEDKKCLTQSMVTAIRLCLLRLSKQKSQPVPLKNFIEVICPVVFREQGLFMKLLKSHTQIKSVAGEKFISFREAPPASATEAKAATSESSSSTALVPAVAGSTCAEASTTQAVGSSADSHPADAATVVAPAAKRQRLLDGSSHATSSSHSATKASSGATPGASAATTSGIKSGAKRVLHHDSAAPVVMTSSAVKQSASAAALSALSNETVGEIVDELFSRIVCKWLSIKSMDNEGKTKLSSKPGAVDTSLTISDMLIIAADLIASLPTFAICVHRYCYNVAKVPEWAADTAKTELPLKHALTGQSVGGLFITFVIHALLLPAKILHPVDDSDKEVSAEQHVKNRAAQNSAVEKITGTTLRDACAYFLASLASRPGDGRKRVLNEILNSANVGAVIINRTDQLRCLVAFAEVLQYLLYPPARWASRDAFILPSKDILVQLAKLNAHTRISAAICAIDLEHPLALEASIVLSVPLETIIKKGLEPAAASAADTTAKTPVALAITAGAASSSSSARHHHDSAAGACASAAPLAITNTDASAGATSSAATATPSVRRATFAPSTLPSAPVAPSQTSNASSAQSFVTPAMTRRRGNTDQSLDAEERLLLLTGSEMHSNSDQHEHLMRPTGAVADSDGSDAGFDDDGEDEEGEHGEREVTLGHDDDMDEGDSDEDGDDDDDGEGEDFDEESVDEDGEDDDDGSDSEGGHRHHHHHAHRHPDDDSESGSEEGDHSGHMDSESDGSGSDDDEGDEDDSHADLNESGDFDMGDEEDDLDGLEEVDDEDAPEMEIEMEFDGDGGDDDGSDGSDHSDDHSGDEGEEGSAAEDEGDEEEDADGDGDEIEEMGLEDESEIDDDDADIDQDGQDEDHMLGASALVRRARGRPPTRRVPHAAAMDDAENPGEGDDDSDSQDEDGDADAHHGHHGHEQIVNENSMDFGGEEGGDEGEEEFNDEDYLEDAEFDPELHAGEDNGDAGEDEGDGDEDDEDHSEHDHEHDHHWLNMGGAAGAGASGGGRRASGSGARPIVRDYFNRVRHHERNRGRNSMGGGGAGGAHAMNDLAALMGAVTRNGGSEVFSFPGGAVLSGGVLQAQGDGDEAVEFESGNAGAFSARRLFMRGGANGGDPFANLGIGGSTDLGASMAASLQQFVTNMLPPNMSMTSSSARVDPRTGAVTLSFGGERRDGSMGVPSGGVDSNMTATAVQPPSHPLLAITDARRSHRFLQPSSNGLAAAVAAARANPFVRSMSFPYQYQQSGSQSTTLDSSFRRGAISVRRRSIGPIVSDRRWGTDMGDVEPAGARLATLTSAVEKALGDVIEKEEPKMPKRRASMDKTQSDKSHDGDKPHPLRRANAFSAFFGHEDMSSPPALGGTHYESDEDGDDGDSSASRTPPEYDDMPRRRRPMGFDPDESKEEEGELQETKQEEPAPAGTSAVASTSQQSATSSTSAASAATPEEDYRFRAPFAPAAQVAATSSAAAVVVPATATTNAVDVMDVVEQSAVAENTAASETAPEPTTEPVAPTEISEENVQFVESLPEELRREVLISAEEDFLRSLPLTMQREAQDLREQQAMELQLGTYELPSSALVPPATSVLLAPVAGVTAPAVAAPAPAPVLVDFASLIGGLLTQAQPPNAISTVATTAPASASASSSAASPPAPAPVPSTNAAGSSAANTTANSGNAATLGLLSRLMAASSASIGSSASSNTVLPSNFSSNASNSGATASNEATSAVISGTIAPAVPAEPTAEEKAAAELALTVALSEDRLDPPPFGSHLMARLLRSMFCTNKTKLPKGILKLLVTVCRYKHGRVWIMRALIGSLSHDGKRVVDCVRRIPLEADCASSAAQTAAFETEMKLLQRTVDETVTNPLNFRRILCGISFLFRKTEKLAWFDIMQRPFPQEDTTWMFGALIALLANPLNSSSVNLEFLLQVMEELCGQYSKMTVKQANILAQAAMERIEASRPPKSGRSVSYATSAPLESIPEGGVEDSGGGKRRRLEEPSTPEVGSLLSPPSRGRAASIDIEGAAEMLATSSSAVDATAGSAVAPTDSSTAMALVTKGDATEADKKEVKATPARFRMPFPVLLDSEAKMLCVLAGSNECGGAARKRLMRVMRNLSLCDTNWMLFLDHLSVVGADLAARATTEFSNLHNTLVEVAQNNETAAAAMARPELSTPRALSEVRLLNVLRIMTALRARSGEAAAAESEVVSSKMRRIQAGSLWDTLCDCLDIVRDLEGITDVGADEAEEKKASSSTADGKKIEEDKKVTLSSLTMRFMPLIECFLTVCATTMLVRPDSVNGSAMNDAQRELERMSSGFKRRYSRDDSAAPSASSAVTSSGGLRTAGRLSPAGMSTPGAHGGLDLTSPMNRVNSMLPGSRFRQHASYFQMQMELSDEASADRLVNFVRQNRILFNNVLRNNVQLLESSFSPLVSVPKCRQLLHFDIKRAYFKMKLKRIRQSSARSHGGALRLNVRRSRVFEESFQALRYKTADEMRRRLSVNFHGEEGMDAGGLTREWYGVLAREIFNPNYALFTSTGDNVTFQPNAQSYINPDHQSYFKFVGRVIGKAICDGHLLDAHFTRSFYKHILGLPVSVVDLEAIDPEYFKSLKQILATPLDLLGLDLTFSAESNDFGVVSIVDLKEHGRDILVTDETKHEYVKLLAHHRMTTAIRKQIDSFLEGFHELVPPELISIFDAQELELLISGLPDIDLDDLRAHTDYHGYKPTDPEMSHFWNVLKSFSKQEKALFLQFVSGTSKVPLDGFQALQGSDGVKQFNIHKAFGGSHMLPSAHTCFNQLDLPEYPSEDVLREKLLIAIREGSEGFGFA